MAIDSARLDINFTATIINALTSASGTPTNTHELKKSFPVTTGTTTTKSDRAWGSLARALSGASSENLDMFDLGSIDIGAGAGLDALGQSVSFVEITGIMIENESSSTGDLSVGGISATTAWNSMFGGSDDDAFLLLQPGDVFMFASTIADPALAVADTTNHLLKMASSASLTYNIMILGRDS